MESVDPFIESSPIPPTISSPSNSPTDASTKPENPTQTQMPDLIDIDKPTKPDAPSQAIIPEYNAGINPDIIEYASVIDIYRDFFRYYERDLNFSDYVYSTCSVITDKLGIEYTITDEMEAYELHCSLYEILDGNPGYVVHDINSDGIPELIILSEDFTIHAIYSLNNDKLILIGAYWSRQNCAIDETGMLFINSSSGASNGYSASYIIAPASVELQMIEMVGMEDYDTQTYEIFSTPVCYRIKDGNKTIIDFEEAFVFWEEFPNRYPNNPTKNAGLIFVPLFI